MVSLDEAVVARLSRHGIAFEILVEPDAAQRLSQEAAPNEPEVMEALAVEDVFIHARDGLRASREELMKGFGTHEIGPIALRILKEGDIQLTQEQRKRMVEQKLRRIVETITRNAWNPQTKTPHPKDRIERALEEAKFHVDPLKRVEEQVNEAMKKLRPLIPIAFERVRIAVRIPAEHTGPAYGHVRHLGDLQKEEWQSDGALIVVLEIPAGAQGEVYERLNALTHGHVETRLLGTK